MKEFKYIANISKEEIINNIVIPCIDEEGKHTIIIKNSVNKTIMSELSTDNLAVKFDVVLFLNNEEQYCHVITAKKDDDYSLSQFNVIYQYIFKKIVDRISSAELMNLIISIEDYFKITPDPNLFSLRVGVFGELFTLVYFYESGYKDIVKKYHDNFYSKHDIEIDDKNRIEIKTTVSEKRIHRFGHLQISRKDIKVFVASVKLELSKEGISLFELFQKAKDLYSDYPDGVFSLIKLQKKCAVDENNVGLIFSLEKAYNDFKIFDADELPKIEADVPDGVTNIKYDVDCSCADSLNITDFIGMLSDN